ncbi:MAG: hydantoinase/oxoprolinase family protein, partial [Chloroflexota bacterium]
VSPVLDNYLGYLESALGETGDRLRVMQSNGGHISIREARLNGVRCILSGPAGGVVGARYTAQLALSMPQPATRPPHPQTQPQRPLSIITFDMGGTSTDVSLVYGDARVTTESVVGGYPIRIPVLDIHTIGAGGGSIASVDLGGALRVGPESAGADPGPACYGRGDGPGLPTVTDANLVLGRLAAEHFLGGEMPLDGSRAAEALTTLGKAMGLDRTRAALGVIEVVNAHMERALRVISVERGYDPRDFTLLSFGGAGGLHAADLARRLDIPQVLIPPLASTLSAFGMLAADVVKDYTQTVMLPGDAPSQAIAAALAPLAARGQAEVLAEGIPDHDVKIERFLDMRYTGQSYELTVPWVEEGPGPLATFQQYHRQAYGYARPQDTSVEIVNVRVRATGRGHPPPITASRPAGADPVEALLEYRPVVLTPTSGPAPVPFYRYEWLRPGNEIAGPAVIVRSDTTLLVGPADEAVVDTYHNLIISVGR